MGFGSLRNEQNRLDNLSWAVESVKNFRHKHFIENYVPGQVVYNLREYPEKFPLDPSEYDFNQFKLMKEHGVGLIQLHEDWNDSIRRNGADKFSTWDPDGLKRFIDLAHAYDIKVIPYMSTGFFQLTDPDYRDDFVETKDHLRSIHFDYAECSPRSASWRIYLMDKLRKILDSYEFDGLYNDVGYPMNHFWAKYIKQAPDGKVTHDWIDQANENIFRIFDPKMIPYDPHLEDILFQVSNLVHERSGVYKVHFCANMMPQMNSRFYDYYWVGESLNDIRHLKQCRDYSPYMVPCPDYMFAGVDEDAFFAMTIPYMQFPLNAGGRPITGTRVLVPDVEYLPPEEDAQRDYYIKVNEWYKAHPDGPHVFGGQWYGTEGREGTNERWYKYFDLYRPMVKNGSWSYLEIQEAGFLAGRVPEDMVVSLFVNEKKYLVVANHGTSSKEISLKGEWADRENGEKVAICRVEPMRVRFLEACEG